MIKLTPAVTGLQVDLWVSCPAVSWLWGGRPRDVAC